MRSGCQTNWKNQIVSLQDHSGHKHGHISCPFSPCFEMEALLMLSRFFSCSWSVLHRQLRCQTNQHQTSRRLSCRVQPSQQTALNTPHQRARPQSGARLHMESSTPVGHASRPFECFWAYHLSLSNGLRACTDRVECIRSSFAPFSEDRRIVSIVATDRRIAESRAHRNTVSPPLWSES